MDVYTDSDWAGCPDTRRSTDAVVVVLGGTVNSAHPQTQPGVPASSSGEAELRGLSRGAKDCLFIKRLCEEDFNLSVVSVPSLWSDATTAIQSVKRLGMGSKLRHMQVSDFIAQEMVKAKLIRIGKVHTAQNPANCLTKYLLPNAKKLSWEDTGMVDINTPMYQQIISQVKPLELEVVASVPHFDEH